ncbi:MAG: sulfatase-like hydrolase/transferase [Candidatus Brocadiia bacterium]
MPDKPHIIIFNPDQWRGDVLGHAGNPAAVTPNLDRLVENDGVSFRHASCQLPVCTPSRCSFMTGWYPHVRGHRSQLYMLRENDPVLLQTLKENGYFVWWGGKNDLVPAQHGFKHVCNIKNQVEGPFEPAESEYQQGEPGSGNYYSFMRGKVFKEDKAGYHRDNDWANIEDAVEFIKQYDRSEPLCLFLALSYPHCPYRVEDPWYSMIDRDKLPPRRPFPAEGNKTSVIDIMAERCGMMDWTEEQLDELRAVYYGMCARVDHQFGLIMEALKDADMYDDSAVFMFSDHGDLTGDYNLPNKSYSIFDDNLIQVPFIIKPPEKVPVDSGVSDAIVELIDFPATVFELTGIEPDWRHFGRSLVPVISGQTTEHRDAAFAEGGMLPGDVLWDEHYVQKYGEKNPYWPAQSVYTENHPGGHKASMCRMREYKYVHRLSESDELYDLVNDPMESKNMIDDPDKADVLERMKDRLMRWYLETSDALPMDLDERW